MPELPEVETIAKELKKKIVGLKITDVWADKEKPFRQAGGLKKFLKEVRNKKIVDVRRRAKFVVIDLDPVRSFARAKRRESLRDLGEATSNGVEDPKSIFIHQKISGHLLYGQWAKKSQFSIFNFQSNSKSQIQNSKQEWVSIISGPLKIDPRNQYIRIIFFLNNGWQLALSDLRRFGKVMLVSDEDLKNLKELKKLGPEPLGISFNQFKNLFAKKKGRLKPVLMDPHFIAGIGNIYSDEILWDAGYHPLKRVEKLKEKDLQKIFDSTKKILRKAIKYRGDSVDDYRLPSGEKGRYQKIQNAYQQTGKKCKKRDGGIIQRLKVGGRSAHFCPKHQRL